MNTMMPWTDEISADREAQKHIDTVINNLAAKMVEKFIAKYCILLICDVILWSGIVIL